MSSSAALFWLALSNPYSSMSGPLIVFIASGTAVLGKFMVGGRVMIMAGAGLVGAFTMRRRRKVN
jgi:hypothetical protein